jgi:anaerobic magnesium-protoporphyrin IX monomethyl ester cyclase
MVQVLLTTLNAKYIHMNLAIRLLYSLNSHRQGLQWHEFTIKEDPNEIAQHCKNNDVVAFSCYIWNIKQSLAVCQIIKQLNPNCTILLGGPEVSYDWQPVIELPYIDLIIEGEGELPFTSLLDNYPNYSKVPGLIYKLGNTIVKTVAPPQFDLTTFTNTNPYQYDEPQSLASKVLYIETSRGCPYKCEFCLASLDNKVRYLPNDYIKNNLLYLMQHGKTIKFLDRTFNIKKDFTIDIFSFILQHYKQGQVFQFEITADIVHPDIISYIKQHIPKGLLRFEIGIQTVNQVANLEVSRKQNFDKTSNVVKELAPYIDLHLDLIVGLPLDYWADIQHSFEQTFYLYPPELQFGFLKFLKGTPMRDKAEAHGYYYDNEAPYQIIRSNYLSELELQRITLLEHALEIYWNKKRAINTCKYIAQTYSIFNFLMGVGELFNQMHSLYKYTLNNVYDVLWQYAVHQYPSDTILHQMISLDYGLAYKVKPGIRYLPEVPKPQSVAITSTLYNKTASVRYMVLPVQFNISKWVNKCIIIPQASEVAIITYTGLNWPQLANAPQATTIAETL